MLHARNLCLCSLLTLAALWGFACSNRTAAQNAEAPAAAEKKPSRAPIYDVDLDAKAAIAAAVKRAQLENKRVLIEWGGNWCGWCYKLYDVFHEDAVVKPIVYEEYELVLIDEGKNRALMEEYGKELLTFGFPCLTVLDSSGKFLTNQETGSLEEGPVHVPEKVAAFLRKWQVDRQDAATLLKQALARAEQEHKQVLVRVGDPYCGWCKQLARFLDDHKTIFEQDYVDLKLDTQRMTEGAIVTKELRNRFTTQETGHPWLAILNAKGEVLAHSVLPETGNFGYPYRDHEIEGFVKMLRDTRQRMSDDQLTAIQKDLTVYRDEREQKLAEEQKAAAANAAATVESL